MTGDALATVLFLVFFVAFVAALGISKRKFNTIRATFAAMFLAFAFLGLLAVVLPGTSPAAWGAGAFEATFPVGTLTALIHAWRNKSQEGTQ